MQHKFLIFLISFAPLAFASDKDLCIEIKDRKNLPTEVYQSLKNNNPILIGEVQGNKETPEFIEGMVNLWLSKNEKVLLGLEINVDFQKEIDSFLTTGNMQLIAKLGFFEAQYNDGRRSFAYFKLIKSCYNKANLKIICYDAPAGIERAFNRDSVMALNLKKALRSNVGSKLIVLSGNEHNKTTKDPAGNSPMGYYLGQMPGYAAQIASIDVVYESGTSWNCIPNGYKTQCQVHDAGSTAGVLAKKYTYDNFFAISEGAKYFFTRRISASEPLNK